MLFLSVTTKDTTTIMDTQITPIIINIFDYFIDVY